MSDVTLLLEQLSAGKTAAQDDLFRLVYDELRRIAAAQMALEKPGQTLQPTALVHEAYLRTVPSLLPMKSVVPSRVSRPAFDDMMKAVRQRRLDVVAVWRLDRLSRGLRHCVNVLGEFRDLGVEFVSVRDGLNFSDPLGMALYALVAALAEAEVEALRERTVAGLKNARAKGKRLGRPPMGTA